MANHDPEQTVEVQIVHPQMTTPESAPLASLPQTPNQPEILADNKVSEATNDKPVTENTTPWHFQAEDTSQDSLSDGTVKETKPIDEPITWSASEFIHHSKSVAWYGLLVLGAVILAALVFFVTRDKISSAVIIIAAIVFGIYANRKPRTLAYVIQSKGIGVGNKFYSYDKFKSFAILNEGAFSSVVLLPLKRFSPLVSLYYDPKDERKITDTLADRLPLDERRQDIVDNLLLKIRY